MEVASDIGGLEFECVLYLIPKCDKCGYEECKTIVSSRAKSLLITARYSFICRKCCGATENSDLYHQW